MHITLKSASSLWVIVFHPVAFSRASYWVLVHAVAYEKTYEEHCDNLAQSLWLRHLAENCSA
jgi:hypothetical protein